MKKEWLIRTKNNHILGPVSLNKIKELQAKGSIKADDEVCSGNGYWFYIREKALVEKYILNSIPQDFNPVSEADTVLALPEVQINEDGTMLPCDDDLAFPDLSDDFEDKEDILNELKMSVELEELEEDSDEDYLEEDNLLLLEGNSPVKPLKKNNKNFDEEEFEEIQTTQVKQSLLNQNTLYLLVSFLFLLALLGFYFRKRLIKGFIETNINKIQLINSAHAQAIPSSVKKK